MGSAPPAITAAFIPRPLNPSPRLVARGVGRESVLACLHPNAPPRAPLPCVLCVRSCPMARWMEDKANFGTLEAAFNSTSNYAKLLDVTCHSAGRNVYLRFRCSTGDAMGMNMVRWADRVSCSVSYTHVRGVQPSAECHRGERSIPNHAPSQCILTPHTPFLWQISKGVNVALGVIQKVVPGMRVLALSGNFCTDKKPSAINWLQGRGKRCETAPQRTRTPVVFPFPLLSPCVLHLAPCVVPPPPPHLPCFTVWCARSLSPPRSSLRH
jgi:hydroxymethylglutaryl-CoA reductase (NADPH)